MTLDQQSRKSSLHEFLLGVQAEMPILLGVTPFGMIYGVLATGAGLTSVGAFAMFVNRFCRFFSVCSGAYW